MKFALGSAMGFALGAGVMRMPGAWKLRRSARRTMQQMKKHMKM